MDDEASTPLLPAGYTLDESDAAGIELLARMLVILAAVDSDSFQRIAGIATQDTAFEPSQALGLAQSFSGLDVGDIQVG